MKNDERERLGRRVDDQWTRRMRALEREFERADRARRPRAERHSIPLAVLTAAVVVLAAVLILQLTKSAADKPEPVAAPAGPFGVTPAAGWADAATGLTEPAAQRAGALSASDVATLLDHARTALLAQRTGEAALAPGNGYAAPVRALGSMTYAFVPASSNSAARFVVSVNVVWAYALRAGYAAAPGVGQVVALHERATLAFTPRRGVPPDRLRPALSTDRLLWFDADCGYRAAGLVGLARAGDPDALPGYSNGVSVDRAFALDATAEITGHVCRG